MSAATVQSLRWDYRTVKWPTWVLDLPNGVRQGVVGSVVLGAVGYLVGLVIGLVGAPDTAWAAGFEIGLPCAFVGFLAGGATGIVSPSADESEHRPDQQ